MQVKTKPTTHIIGNARTRISVPEPPKVDCGEAASSIPAYRARTQCASKPKKSTEGAHQRGPESRRQPRATKADELPTINPAATALDPAHGSKVKQTALAETISAYVIVQAAKTTPAFFPVDRDPCMRSDSTRGGQRSNPIATSLPTDTLQAKCADDQLAICQILTTSRPHHAARSDEHDRPVRVRRLIRWSAHIG